METAPIQLYDVVALLAAKPDEGLVRGQVGTVVMEFPPAAYEVEFLSASGKTVGIATCTREELLLLQHDAVAA